MKETNVWDNKNLLKILPFYNILIDFMEKPKSYPRQNYCINCLFMIV